MVTGTNLAGINAANMTGILPDHTEPAEANGKVRPGQYVILGATCALVIAVYAWSAKSGALELSAPGARDTFYNLLVQSFRAGRLNLKMEAPAGLAELADPYDPAANA